MVVYSQIVVFYQLEPSSLLEVEVGLSEYIYQAFVVGVYFTPLANKVVPPCLQGVDNGG